MFQCILVLIAKLLQKKLMKDFFTMLYVLIITYQSHRIPTNQVVEILQSTLLHNRLKFLHFLLHRPRKIKSKSINIFSKGLKVSKRYWDYYAEVLNVA